MSESSRLLVTRAALQDRAAIEELLVLHLPRLRAWLRLRMGAQLRSRETPDDLVQSVAREVVADLSRFEWRGEPAFRHWLYTTAQRKLVDKARHVRAAQRSPEFEQRLQPDASDPVFADLGTLCTPSAEAASNEELARIERALDELPEDYREAIGMQRLCGMDYAAIAIEMKRSEGAVRNLVYRGLSRLALRLGELRAGKAGPEA